MLAKALALVATLGVSACGLFGGDYRPVTPATPPVPENVRLLNQGPKWDQANRAAFYAQDQGSRLMPLAWFKALRLKDNTRLAPEGLARFGYLANPDSPAGLPVGFTSGTWRNTDYAAMTCAACHTRQIRAEGVSWRVDGGPALTDLWGLFAEIDGSVQRVLSNSTEFKTFAVDVLGKDAPAAAVDKLRADLTAWAGPYHTLMEKSLSPGKPWGVGRADAVGMILNRLGGLDLGEAPGHVIAGNIRPADAPVRYPFLWNATIQNKTQWPGFAPNGNDLFGLIRNLGEVYGVFGVFYPERRPDWVSGIDFITTNSANFKGLDRLEQMTSRIGKPAWPWAVDAVLKAQGEKLYKRADRNGQSCESCHGIVRQKVPLLPATWKTPLIDVGTDSREYATLQWDGDSGVLNGAKLPFVDPIKPRDSLVTMLSVATAGAIMQKAGLREDPFSSSLSLLTNDPKRKNQSATANAGHKPPSTDQFKYEARVMQGIWAAGPYLHNGSVPTLADLLEPWDRRPARFDVGADYDIKRLGLAAAQTGPLLSTTQTTGCEDRTSGNSRCGHEGPGFGTAWSAEEKRALLEYLKTL